MSGISEILKKSIVSRQKGPLPCWQDIWEILRAWRLQSKFVFFTSWLFIRKSTATSGEINQYIKLQVQM